MRRRGSTFVVLAGLAFAPHALADATGRCATQDERIRGRQARRRHDPPRHLPPAARARKWRLGGASDVRRPRLTATQHRTDVEARPAPAPAGGRLVAAAAFALPPL